MADNECRDCQTAETQATDSAAAAAACPPKAGPSKQQEEPQPHKPPAIGSVPACAPEPPTPSIIIEYCDRCRWQHRASWIQTELLITFPCPRPPTSQQLAQGAAKNEATDRRTGGIDSAVGVKVEKPPTAGLRSVTIIPRTGEDEGGIFRVWVLVENEGRVVSSLLWDRKSEGRFPEPKELKQKIRDIISPSQSLGHSDRKS